ncbi:hypothetical protein OEZ86_009851 [Tetradesmus obliquus]|nr:hypothetical protein OEZ86_009851 [Tetradesmus obliquus]
MASGFEANSKHIARFAAKPYPQQQPSDAVTPAFEGYAYGKIVGQLRSDNAVIKAKAVVAAKEMLCMPLKRIQCISAGITSALVELLGAPDESLQASAATTLQSLVASEVGCRDMLQHGGLPQLLQLLKQPSAAVRDAVYGALCAAAHFEALRTALMQEQGAMRQLLGHVQQEEAGRAAQALELLVHCTQVRHNHDALTKLIYLAHAVPKLAALISNSNTPEPVRLGATRLLAALMSTQEDGRTQAVEAGCVPVLLQLTARSFRGLLHRTLCVFVHVHAHEVPSVLYSFFALFSLLGSYFLLLPLREDAGISLGTSSLPALCACTLAVTLLFIPAASAFLSRSHPNSREVALQQFYYFMAGVLLVFYFLYSYAAIDSRLLRGAFYVWVNVMNLVCISSLWARCADAFTPEAGARLFGFISAGATLGQLMGSLMAMLVVGSLMYFQRALVVSTSVRGPSQRTAFFAALNTWSAACILLMQLFATSSLLRYLGMQAALGLGPLICLAGICSISSAPSPAMVAVFEVVRKVFAYAVYRPSREVLFTVVSRDEKYSAKLVIDTVVQRLGDALAAAAFQVLDVQWSLGQAGVGAAGVAMCFVWLATAHKLGQHHKQLAKADAAVREKMTL